MKRKLSGILLAGLLIFTLCSQSVYAQMGPDDDFMGPGGPPNDGNMQDFGPGMGPPPGGMHQGTRGHNKMGGKQGMMGAFKELNLTDTQKEKLKAQRSSAQTQLKGLREQLMNEKQKMMTMMFDPNANKSTMYAQQEKVNSIQNQLTKLRIDNISSFKEILTPEQKQKLQQIGSEKMKKMQEMKNKMGERMKQRKRPAENNN